MERRLWRWALVIAVLGGAYAVSSAQRYEQECRRIREGATALAPERTECLVFDRWTGETRRVRVP